MRENKECVISCKPSVFPFNAGAVKSDLRKAGTDVCATHAAFVHLGLRCLRVLIFAVYAELGTHCCEGIFISCKQARKRKTDMASVLAERVSVEIPSDLRHASVLDTLAPNGMCIRTWSLTLVIA